MLASILSSLLQIARVILYTILIVGISPLLPAIIVAWCFAWAFGQDPMADGARRVAA